MVAEKEILFPFDSNISVFICLQLKKRQMWPSFRKNQNQYNKPFTSPPLNYWVFPYVFIALSQLVILKSE